MKFELDINCDNDAFFEDQDLQVEVRRILFSVAGLIKLSTDPSKDFVKHQNLKDINGNIVGTWRLK